MASPVPEQHLGNRAPIEQADLYQRISRVESDVSNLARTVEHYIDEASKDKDAIIDKVDALGVEFRTSRRTNPNLIVSIIGVVLVLGSMCAGLMLFAGEAAVGPLRSSIAAIEVKNKEQDELSQKLDSHQNEIAKTLGDSLRREMELRELHLRELYSTKIDHMMKITEEKFDHTKDLIDAEN